MMKKPFELILRDAGSTVQTRSTGGGVEQRLLRMVRRRRSARLHVVGGATSSSPRLHVVVCKGAAGVFPSKSRTST